MVLLSITLLYMWCRHTVSHMSDILGKSLGRGICIFTMHASISFFSMARVMYLFHGKFPFIISAILFHTSSSIGLKSGEFGGWFAWTIPSTWKHLVPARCYGGRHCQRHHAASCAVQQQHPMTANNTQWPNNTQWQPTTPNDSQNNIYWQPTTPNDPTAPNALVVRKRPNDCSWL